MADKYYAPGYNLSAFHCPRCGVYSQQRWDSLGHVNGVHAFFEERELDKSTCDHCYQPSFWYRKVMIYPASSSVELPHDDMPGDCKEYYEEARCIFNQSPRGAAALLRLCLQCLCSHLGESGKNLNDDIGKLVSKGLSPQLQQALDYCRVVGNNAVHPGVIVIEDQPEVATRLFELINFIVYEMITKPRQIAGWYDELPVGFKQAIKERDEV